MLRIQFQPPPLDERLVSGFSDGIADVRFEEPLTSVYCVVTLKQGADIQRVSKQITEQCVYGMKLKVELLEDHISLYQEHPESDDSDDYIVNEDLLKSCQQGPPVQEQEEMDADTFVALIGMHVRSKAARSNQEPVAVIDLTDDSHTGSIEKINLDDKEDEEDTSFIQDVQQVSNKNQQRFELDKVGESSATLMEHSDVVDKVLDTHNSRTLPTEKNDPLNSKEPEAMDSTDASREFSIRNGEQSTSSEPPPNSNETDTAKLTDTDEPLKYPCELLMNKMFDL